MLAEIIVNPEGMLNDDEFALSEFEAKFQATEQGAEKIESNMEFSPAEDSLCIHQSKLYDTLFAIPSSHLDEHRIMEHFLRDPSSREDSNFIWLATHHRED
jgi:hypothetical protein